MWEWDLREVAVPAIVEGTCEERHLTESAQDALARRGDCPDYSQYEHILTVIPPPANCSWWGTVWIGMWNRPAATGSNGFTGALGWIARAPTGSHYWATYAHELAHNLGVQHANSETRMYGDVTDAMGRGIGCFNAARQYFMGWTPPANVREVTVSGYHTLTDLNAPAVTAVHPQILKIWHGGEWMFLAYRQRHDANPFTQNFDRHPEEIRKTFGSAGPSEDDAIHIHTQAQYHMESQIRATVKAGDRYAVEAWRLVGSQIQYYDSIVVAHISHSRVTHTAVVYIQLHCEEFPASPCPVECQDRANWCASFSNWCELESTQQECPRTCGMCSDVPFPSTPAPAATSTPAATMTPPPVLPTPSPTQPTEVPATPVPAPAPMSTPQPTEVPATPVSTAPTTVGPSGVNLSLRSHNGGVFGAASGSISDGYGVYPNSADLSVVVEGENCVLTWREVDVEDGANCRYDAVTVEVNGAVVATVCGEGHSEPDTQLMGNGFTLRLRSDYSVQRTGFELDFECEGA